MPTGRFPVTALGILRGSILFGRNVHLCLGGNGSGGAKHLRRVVDGQRLLGGSIVKRDQVVAQVTAAEQPADGMIAFVERDSVGGILRPVVSNGAQFTPIHI